MLKLLKLLKKFHLTFSLAVTNGKNQNIQNNRIMQKNTIPQMCHSLQEYNQIWLNLSTKTCFYIFHLSRLSVFSSGWRRRERGRGLTAIVSVAGFSRVFTAKFWVLAIELGFDHNLRSVSMGYGCWQKKVLGVKGEKVKRHLCDNLKDSITTKRQIKRWMVSFSIYRKITIFTI